MVLKIFNSDESFALEKAIGKPYSQQPGRKMGEGAGHISSGVKQINKKKIFNYLSPLEDRVTKIAFKRISNKKYKFSKDEMNKMHNAVSKMRQYLESIGLLGDYVRKDDSDEVKQLKRELKKDFDRINRQIKGTYPQEFVDAFLLRMGVQGVLGHFGY